MIPTAFVVGGGGGLICVSVYPFSVRHYLWCCLFNKYIGKDAVSSDEEITSSSSSVDGMLEESRALQVETLSTRTKAIGTVL